MRICKNGFKYFRQESIAYLNRQHAVVERGAFENICKEAAYHYVETIIGDGPCGVLPAASAAEVFASYQYLTRIGRVIEHKILWIVLVVKAPVAEQVIAKSFAGSGL